MSESLEELKAIIDNAPEGATHFGIDCIYYQYKKADSIAIWREYTKRKSTFVLNQCICMMGLRSLSDIKRIIELEEWKIEANLNHQSMLGAYLND